MSLSCIVCGKRAYSEYCVQHKPRKPIITKNRPAPQSAKEQAYQVWKEEVARPYLIARDGNNCSCCKRPAFANEKLDIEHTLGKGSHPGMKKDLDNLTLMCRCAGDRVIIIRPIYLPVRTNGLINPAFF